MTLIERLLIVVIFFVMASCSIKETNEGESLGELALGVFSVTSDADKFNTNLAIIVVLKHEESGFIHNIEVDFKEGRRLVYVKNLRPGLYTALEYRYGAHKGDDPIFNYPLEPVVPIEVKSKQTVLFPMVVSMSAIYPVGGLSDMADKSFWLGLLEAKNKDRN